MHPRAAQLITCIQLETEWQEQMDQFMVIGNDDLSLYERLAVYQRNHREVPRLDTDKFLEKQVDFYFPSEHFLCRINKKRTLSLSALRSTVKKHLRRFLHPCIPDLHGMRQESFKETFPRCIYPDICPYHNAAMDCRFVLI